MNEIDPSNSNGSVTTETHQQETSLSANKSPLLTSLLTSVKHDSISNGQQNKSGQHKNDPGMMPTPAIVTNPQYEEASTFMTRKSASQNNESASELDLTTINSNRKFNSLNDLLQRNNNNNKVTAGEPTAKSILENCLLKPSPYKNQRLESQFYPKMDEGDYHHHHHHLGTPSTSSVLKFAHQSEDSRKVEPLKINLNREPIRTVIKLPQSHPYESHTKITIKPPQPLDRNSMAPATISPTLSSSSSLSSESSFDNCNDISNNQRPSSIQVIPKLHIRNLLDGTHSHEQSELHIVPKLTITGLNSPQSTVNHMEQQQIQQQQQSVKDHSVNNILETSPAIPKLTIKKDNNTSDYHLNNDSNTIPKLHIKTNHHQAKEVVKLTIKPFPEPPVPKLTIKTKADNDAMIVTNSEEVIEQQQSLIPKLTIKSNQSLTPKLTIKPVMRPTVDEQEESIPKLTLKAVNNSATVQTFEKVVPKLVVKVPKEPIEDGNESSCSLPPSHVPKLNIKPIPLSEKEVPKPTKNYIEPSPMSVNKFSIDRLIGSSDTTTVDNDELKILEINTTSIIKNTDSGQDSPRIILKINKTNSESITSEIVPQPTIDVAQKAQAVNNKRVHSNNDDNDHGIDLVKKQKLTEDDDDDDDDDEVILINDSDTSSSDTLNKNQLSAIKEAAKADQVKKPDETKTNLTGLLMRNLRQSRRNHEVQKKSTTPAIEQESSQSVKEDSQPASERDPLALSNDATANSNSVDEIITPKRGRGRPKKIVEKPPPVEEESRDPLDMQLNETAHDSQANEEGVEVKKTPSRGRGRGRGRVKRTVEVIKNGKSIQITLEGHDDDDSPSFSLYNRTLNRGGFTAGRKSRGGKNSRGKNMKASPFITPERSKDGPFMSPNEQNNRRKLFITPSLFEEDTRMSIGCDSSQQTSIRYSDMQSCEESQSSLLSSASNTVEGSSKKRSKKMEVCEPEGRTEFTIELLAEYEWPQNEGRNHDTFMIQEQIAEYLGVKSFKRKYPDLVRRTVDMEERNYLFENGFASEKMCDLGLTAVYASEVLDIMCNDYPEKYEEYKRYQREKAFRFARLRLETAVVDRSQMQKDKAITSASEFNNRFNKDRRENRRSCMDLQNFLIQKPTPIRYYKTTPSVSHQSHYPLALVPGQFSEFYEKYTPLQLACYPVNTVLVDQKKLEQYLAIHPNALESSEFSDISDSEEEETSSSDSDVSDSESSSDDEYEDPRCRVCSQTPFMNQFKQPEKFITCSTCKHQAHPSCIEMSNRMFIRTLAYKWQCSNCKTCCKCRKIKDNKMLFCVQCDRGFHIYCLGLRNVPEGQYHCDNCNICSECGAKSPEGHFNPSLSQQQRQDLAMIAQWNHEFIINPLTNIREHKASSCLPCFRKANEKRSDD